MAHNAQASTSAIRWAISALVVASPIFLFVSRITRGDIRRDPAKRSSRVRRWLTYATMAVASAVLMSDLTVLVNGVLSGGLVASFVLKTLVVGLIAGAILGSYLADLRRDEGSMFVASASARA